MPGNLQSAILTANSGRELAQQQAARISHNISNVHTENFSRKELDYTSRVLGGVGAGVKADELKRVTDEIRVEQLRVMHSKLEKMEVVGRYMQQQADVFGQPGGNNLLNGSLNELRRSIEELSLRPESDGSRKTMIRAAEKITYTLNQISTDTQTSRATTEAEISQSVNAINNYLDKIYEMNHTIRYAAGRGESIAELQDKQDIAVAELSKLMDVRVQRSSDHTVSIFTTRGQTLLQSELHHLTFDQTSGIDATVSYPATMNGILIDGDLTKDITNDLSEGRLAGLIAVRDMELPAFQAALDEMTGVLRDEINRVHNRGTSSFVPDTLTGTRVGFLPGDAIAGSGDVKVAVIDKATGNIVEETVIDLSTIGTHDNLRLQIDGMANATATFLPSGALQINAPGVGYGISVGSVTDPEATITSGGENYGMSHYFGFNDFFVTGTTGTGTAPGISAQLQVRSEIASDPRRIVNTQLDTSKTVGERAVSDGGNKILLDLTQMFESAHTFAAAGHMNMVTNTFNTYASNVIQYTAETARTNVDLYESQKTLFDLTEKSLDSIRGVNLQEEVAELSKWLNYQKFNIEVMKAANSMMDELITLVGRR